MTHLLQTMQRLRQQVQAVESVHRFSPSRASGTGFPELDALLPAGGFCPGQLVEWLAPGPGCGVDVLALHAAREAIRFHERQHRVKSMVVVDRARLFYPPAAVAWGIPLRQLMVVRPENAADELWAIDQSLRCPAVAAVYCGLPRLASRDFRRLQLAAEQGGSLGLFMRPATVRGNPSWSDVQLLVTPVPTKLSRESVRCHYWQRQWQVEILRCRGTRAERTTTVQITEGCPATEGGEPSSGEEKWFNQGGSPMN